MTFSALLSGAAKLRDLFRLLESGELASLLADIEFAAAKEAFERIAASIDKRAQVRTCIGHLNSCYHGYAAALAGMSTLDRTLWARGDHFEAIKIKAIFILCVRGICHRYLGEENLWPEDFKLATSMRNRQIQSVGLSGLWFVSGAVINPLVYIDLVTMVIKNELPQARIYELDEPGFERLRQMMYT